ncbi:hypothetical protein T4B_11901 [Trichinella pseudospiralis]|uniref:Uncharacterized protein n=1 Tax=Trichinella pseudospiralis TaxID=6337 RepID=A0A0V1GMJ0_TRIPS|nr:hypothetical protein T4B_11901 [Trichinella pseudospiralis]
MLMKQRKVKAGMTPSKSWTTHRKKEMRRGTLRGVLTKSVFCYGAFCQIVYILTEFSIDHFCREVEFNSAFYLFILYGVMGYNLSSVREGFNALKTGFRRCIMQITIAIKSLFKMKNTKSENADDTKQNKKRTRGICGSPWVPIL